jgi:hypothetical protein
LMIFAETDNSFYLLVRLSAPEYLMISSQRFRDGLFLGSCVLSLCQQPPNQVISKESIRVAAKVAGIREL